MPSFSRIPLSLLSVYYIPALAAECTADCEGEFRRCHRYKLEIGESPEEGWTSCTEELEENRGPITQHCKDPSCTQTAGMLALKGGDSDDGGDSGDRSPVPAPTDGPRNPVPAPTDGPDERRPTGLCSLPLDGKPTEPTLCSPRDSEVLTYAYFPMAGQWADVQRHFTVFNLPNERPVEGPMALVIQVKGYGGEGYVGRPSSAEYYRFVYLQIASPIGDGAGGFSLQFGNNGVVNDENPMPCSEEDSRDIVYLRKMMEWVDQQIEAGIIDPDRIFSTGFSQDSMFAAYLAVCFSEKFAGVWQGGSGMARKGWNPVTPGGQAQCCDCKYWPIYPKTCAKTQPKRKIVDCIMSYAGDGIACGTHTFMYDAMVQEGNDARLLTFPGGGHGEPASSWAWKAGCLGITDSCSSKCEASYMACVENGGYFGSCMQGIVNESLEGCKRGCSPTLKILLTSQTAKVTLSEGRFGTQDGLPAAGDGPVGEFPREGCNNYVGPFTSNRRSGCNSPTDDVFPDFNERPSDDLFCGRPESGDDDEEDTSSPVASPTPSPIASPTPSPETATPTTPSFVNLAEFSIYCGKNEIACLSCAGKWRREKCRLPTKASRVKCRKIKEEAVCNMIGCGRNKRNSKCGGTPKNILQ